MAAAQSDIVDKVKQFQASIGAVPDGIIGTNTIKALQRKVGVKADGILGPKTRAAAKKAGIPIPGSEQLAYMNKLGKAAKKAETRTGTRGTVVAVSKHKAAAVPSITRPNRIAVHVDPPIPTVAKPVPIPAALLAPPAPIAPVSSPVPDDLIPTALASMPTEAKAQAAMQLAQLAQIPGVEMSDYDKLVASLSATMVPQLSAISEALKQRQVANQATAESNSLLAADQQQQATASNWNANTKNWELNAEQWASNAQTQTKILEAIANIASRVTAQNAIQKRMYKAYGIPL